MLANFTADPQPVALSVLRDHGFALTERGRRARRPRLETYHDFIVLAPYQHLWFGDPGASRDL